MARWRWLSSLGILCLSAPVEVKWHISIAWEDQDCNSVCSFNGLLCTEACWPLTAKGLQNALLSSGLQDTCFGIDAGNPNPWHPAKDAENTMCYWFGGHTASQAPRCPHKSSTSAELLADSKVIRRLCPCVGVNSSSSSGFNCGLGDQPTDAVVVAQPQASTSTTTQAEDPGEDPGVENPPAVPEVLQPPMALCQELCVSGFGSEDEKLNGKYIRLGAADGSLNFWLKLGGLPTGADCRIARGTDGVWRYYEVTSQGNTSIGEGTLRTPINLEIPKDDYVLTPTGGFQVEYQCCPQQLATESSTLPVGTDQQLQEDTTNTAMIAIAIGGAIVLFISIVVICVIQWWKPGILRSRKYQAFEEKVPQQPADVEKMQPITGHSQMAPKATSSTKAATWNTSWSPSRKGPSEHSSPAGGTLLPSARNADRRANAVADVLGKASTMASEDGIYEGPTRQWWGGSSSNGLGGTGFHQGARVRLQGLTASTWNGAQGTVEGWDPQKGALEVKVNGTLKLVKPENCVKDMEPTSSTGGGDLTPAQMRMQLNAAQMNLTGPPVASSSALNSRPEGGASRLRQPIPDTSQVHKVAARSRPSGEKRDERRLPGPSIAAGLDDNPRTGNWRSHAPPR